jgi:DNA sulfur modification protein DndD
MIINLLGWKSYGLRCPDTEVAFDSSGKTKSINLVQMPNGTGKSTIIELIGAALTGNGTEWSPYVVKQFSNNNDYKEYGEFELRLSIEMPGKKAKNIAFKLDFDFETGNVLYSTLRDPTVGMDPGWDPPSELRPFLDEKCVEVFVFKGDKVEHLLDKDRSDAEMSIKAFFGLLKLEELSEFIEEDFQKRSGSVRTVSGQTQKRKNLEDWFTHRRLLKEREKTYISELKPLYKIHDILKGKVEKAMAGQTRNNAIKKELEKALNESEVALSSATKECFESLRNPFFISNKISLGMETLHDNLEKLKLPGTSRVFFEELRDSDNCICDRPMDKAAKAAIIKNCEGFLSDDEINIINGIKRDIDKYSSIAKSKQKEEPFKKQEECIKKYNEDNQSYKSHVAIMENEVIDKQKDMMDEFKDILGKIQEKENILKVLQKKEGSYLDAKKRKPNDCRQLFLIDKVIEKLEEELTEIDGTVEELRAKNKLKKILSDACQLANDNLKNEIREQCNIKLKKIIPEGDWLEVKKIDNSIIIGFGDKEQHRGSGGQNVAVAYSFATTLLERSGAEFPLIVDHPVTALMESARRELGKKLAEICHQFVGFIIDTEKNGFTESLKNHTNSIQYITLFKKIKGNEIYLEMLPKDKNKVLESENGIVCMDEVFFEQFKDVNPDEDI